MKPVHVLTRFSAAVACFAALGVSGCAVGVPKIGLNAPASGYAASAPGSTREFFPESLVGVAASPRVTMGRAVPRGGGRNQIGKPYTVRGKRYVPTAVPVPVETGTASWYGSAFHGRKTANGEVYDMNRLSAAHPTMPIPSYARVTNLENGRSIMVRVNDRGPFARGRVIDLSKRAAETLGYTHRGTARVKVEYAGRAPLHGEDDAFLAASLRNGPVRNGAGQRSPSGFLVALNGASPLGGAAKAVRGVFQPVSPRAGLGVSSYADQRVAAAFEWSPGYSASSSWKRR